MRVSTWRVGLALASVVMLFGVGPLGAASAGEVSGKAGGPLPYECRWPQWHQARDLDGDGAHDILWVTCTEYGEQPQITAISGRTGATLWNQTVYAAHFRQGYVNPNAEGPAFILVVDDYGWTTSLSLVISERYPIKAVAFANDGTIAWETRASASRIHTAVSPLGGPVIEPKGSAILPSADGSPDVAFSMNVYGDIRGEQTDSEVIIDVIDGVTGRVRSVTRLKETIADPMLDSLGDITGDGRGDVGVLDVGTGQLWAFSSAPLELLWSAPTDARSVWEVGGFPDVTGDGRGEVSLGHLENDPTASQLLDGATGQALPVQGSPIFELGDVDGDGTQEVGAVNYVDGDTRYEAIRGTGEVLTRSSQSPTNGGPAGSHDYFVGDVDADGVVDATYYTGSGGVIGILSGRTWGSLWTYQLPYPYGPYLIPAHVSFDGDGDDFFTSRDEGREVVAVDGRTGGQLWSRTSPPGWGTATGVDDVNGDGRGDLALTIGDPFQIMILSGSDGSTLWSMPIG